MNKPDDNVDEKKQKDLSFSETSVSTPPLVKSLLLRAVKILSKQPLSNKGTDDEKQDPTSSLFLRSGKQSGTEVQGLDFLVDVKKVSENFDDACILEPLPKRYGDIPVAKDGKLTFKDKINTYLALGKFRLSSLVVVTCSFGYGLAFLNAPMVSNISSMGHLTTFTAATIGTALLAGAANTFNQFLEAPYDAQSKSHHI